jgi:hypothetical protein
MVPAYELSKILHLSDWAVYNPLYLDKVVLNFNCLLWQSDDYKHKNKGRMRINWSDWEESLPTRSPLAVKGPHGIRHSSAEGLPSVRQSRKHYVPSCSPKPWPLRTSLFNDVAVKGNFVGSPLNTKDRRVRKHTHGQAGSTCTGRHTHRLIRNRPEPWNYFFFTFRGLRLSPLGTYATNCPIVPAPDDT